METERTSGPPFRAGGGSIFSADADFEDRLPSPLLPGDPGGKKGFPVVWRGHVRHFLLPIHPDRYNPALFLHAIAKAEFLKELFSAIQTETDAQFDILSRIYVFYLPGGFSPRVQHRRKHRLPAGCVNRPRDAFSDRMGRLPWKETLS
jgi:hypothetical protein